MVHSCDVCFQCQHRSYNKDMAAVDKKTAQKVALDIESLRKDIGAVGEKQREGRTSRRCARWGLAVVARHVIGCCLTQGTRVQSAFDYVVRNILWALAHGGCSAVQDEVAPRPCGTERRPDPGRPRDSQDRVGGTRGRLPPRVMLTRFARNWPPRIPRISRR